MPGPGLGDATSNVTIVFERLRRRSVPLIAGAVLLTLNACGSDPGSAPTGDISTTGTVTSTTGVAAIVTGTTGAVAMTTGDVGSPRNGIAG